MDNLQKKMGKKDLIFLGVFLLAGVLLLLWFLLGYREAGNQVEITVGDKMYGTYDLQEEQQIPIENEGTITNTLLIQNGKANMVEASCPDQVCVRHVSISHVGENIVCLPNKIVVSITGEKEPQIDSVVR